MNYNELLDQIVMEASLRDAMETEERWKAKIAGFRDDLTDTLKSAKKAFRQKRYEECAYQLDQMDLILNEVDSYAKGLDPDEFLKAADSLSSIFSKVRVGLVGIFAAAGQTGYVKHGTDTGKTAEIVAAAVALLDGLGEFADHKLKGMSYSNAMKEFHNQIREYRTRIGKMRQKLRKKAPDMGTKKTALAAAVADSLQEESAQYLDDWKLVIYESCSDGDISEEERDTLLEAVSTDPYVLEGANSEVHKIFKEAKSDCKEYFKKLKKALKENDTKTAKACIDRIDKTLEKAEKAIDEVPETLGSALIGAFILNPFIEVLKGAAIGMLSIIPILGPIATFGGGIYLTIKTMLHSLDGAAAEIKHIASSSDDETDKGLRLLNSRRQLLRGCLNDLRKHLKKLKKVVDMEEDLEESAYEGSSMSYEELLNLVLESKDYE